MSRVNFNGVNVQAIPLSPLAQDRHRTYLAVFAQTDVTVTISGGTPFTIAAGNQWGPQPAPINDIAFAGSGTIVVG